MDGMNEAWLEPPVIKIYEALGAVADGRVEVSGNAAKVWSSSRGKAYDVAYDPEARALMANDNGSYWKGYLGYPGIAFLLANGTLPYRAELGELLAGIAWKDINQELKNDFDRTLERVLGIVPAASVPALQAYVAELQENVAALGLTKLGPRTKPPAGY